MQSAGNSLSGTGLTGNAGTLQTSLDAKKDTLLSSLSATLQRVQQVYENKVKVLVETSMFRAVECLGFLSATSTDVDVESIRNEYQKAILEKYVEISADVKRFSVGLLTNEKTISDAIYDFGQSFVSQISAIENTYETTFATLKSDFEVYYTQNKDLVYDLAEKIQKIDTIKAQYTALQQAQSQLYQALDEKTTVRTSLSSPKRSAANLLKGDIDDLIRGYQVSNPEVAYEKIVEKRDTLLAEFEKEADTFINEIFKADFDYSLYLTTIAKTEEFLQQYTAATSYQCGMIIASLINWERVYLELLEELQTLTQGMENARWKVEDWDANQIKVIESTMMTLFKDYYSKALTSKKNTFMASVMQLISEAYYANQPQPEVPVTPNISWTPYTFTKTYNKGVYAVELTYLQQFFKAQNLYTGEINGLYDAKTIEAVYRFQLQEGVITGKETNKAAYGRMGPATRAAINKKMNP
ncbi:MAG: peptidoglycan-binding protein [Candidatus Peribacteria bacterium]|nr:peptidoglycan-binding protein [Candidatus Peribacteria bacterium]